MKSEDRDGSGRGLAAGFATVSRHPNYGAARASSSPWLDISSRTFRSESTPIGSYPGWTQRRSSPRIAENGTSGFHEG